MMETALNVFALKDIPDGRADKASKDTISALKITSSQIGHGNLYEVGPYIKRITSVYIIIIYN